MAIIFSEQEKELKRIFDRMDKFDSIVVEYLRKYSFTTEDLCEKIGCSPSSLWRYRKQIDAFQKAPFVVICNMLRLANVSNQDLRYICGLPRGLADE